jgi:hypothetical protein
MRLQKWLYAGSILKTKWNCHNFSDHILDFLLKAADIFQNTTVSSSDISLLTNCITFPQFSVSVPHKTSNPNLNQSPYAINLTLSFCYCLKSPSLLLEKELKYNSTKEFDFGLLVLHTLNIWQWEFESTFFNLSISEHFKIKIKQWSKIVLIKG